MTALWEKADLIVTGSRGLSREEKEFTVVSVSHRIASHVSWSTLVLKGGVKLACQGWA